MLRKISAGFLIQKYQWEYSIFRLYLSTTQHVFCKIEDLCSPAAAFSSTVPVIGPVKVGVNSLTPVIMTYTVTMEERAVGVPPSSALTVIVQREAAS